MADVVSNIVLQFKTDTRQAKRGLKELQGEQKKAAQAALKSAESQNEALDAQIARWGKIAAGVGAAVVAFKTIQAATEKYAKISQIELASTGADIDAIVASANGLLSRYEALQFAAAALNTDFKLSQQEMETVSRFMIVLRNQGNDMGEVYKEVTKSLVEANAEGLRKFGINIKATTGSVEAHTKILERMNQEVLAAGELSDISGDKSVRASKRWQDAMDVLTKSLGEVGDALAPIVEMLALVVTATAEIGENLAEVMGEGVSTVQAEMGAADRRRAQAFFKRRRERVEAASTQAAEDLMEIFRRAAPAVGSTIAGEYVASVANWFSSPGGKEKTGRAAERMMSEIERGWTTYAKARAQGVTGGELPSAPTAISQAAGAGRFSGLMGFQAMNKAGITEPLQDNTEALLMQARAWMTLQDAMVSATAAMISGSMSMGEAVKAMTAQILGALGNEMLVKAAREIAEGFAAMANPLTAPAAGGHFAAAAKFSAGAALAYGFAGAMGRSGGRRGAVSGGGRAMPPAAAGAVGGVQGGAGSSVVIYVGSDFEDNPRANAQRLRKAFDRADRTRPGGSAVVNG